MEGAVSETRVQTALQMSRRALLALVKDDGLSRTELEIGIADLAAAKRAAGRTRQEGYNDFITRDNLGVELYRQLLKARDIYQ
jgi:hypothetical protein